MQKDNYVCMGTIFDSDVPPPTPTKTVTLYVAGSRNEEVGAGGWAATIVEPDQEARCLSGYEYDTTAYRLLVIATVAGLRSLQKPTSVRLVTGDDFLYNGITTWVHDWPHKGWKNIKYRELWEQILELLRQHRISPERLHPADDDPVARMCQRTARSQANIASYS